MQKQQKMLVVLVALLLACANLPHHSTTAPESLEDSLPRDSFVFLLVKEFYPKCTAESCTAEKSISMGSGFVIDKTKTGSLVMTAAHVCMPEYDKSIMTIIVSDIDDKKYDASALKWDEKNDLCLLFVEKLKRPALKLSMKAPVPGDRLYNIAAPVGIFNKQMVPILEGRYNGIGYNGSAIYSLVAAPGSSGSMILNYKFELVGMIQALHTRFPTITIGPSYKVLKKFITENAPFYRSL